MSLFYNKVNKKKSSVLDKKSRESTPEWKMKDFQIQRELGEGQFGKVLLAHQKRTGFIVALKWINRKNGFHQLDKQIKNEVLIHSYLQHPNILKLYGYFAEEQAFCLILQYGQQGDLFGLLLKEGKLSECKVSIILRQVCEAVLYLEKEGVIHRDIKPENILICGGKVKLGDFGWSCRASNSKKKTLCGSEHYLAPEMVRGEPYDDTVNCWQIGILAYQLSVGVPPFSSSPPSQSPHTDISFPSHISFQLRTLIRSLLHKAPHSRLPIKQVLHHPFVTKYTDVDLNMICN